MLYHSPSAVLRSLSHLICALHGNESLPSSAVPPAARDSQRKPGTGKYHPWFGSGEEAKRDGHWQLASSGLFIMSLLWSAELNCATGGSYFIQLLLILL